MSTLNLYQFELCPYCHKVKAALDLKGIPYNKIEVNPMTKEELKGLGPAPAGRRKVPVVEFNGTVIRDSSEIIRWLDTLEFDGINLVPKEEPKSTKIAQNWLKMLNKMLMKKTLRIEPHFLTI